MNAMSDEVETHGQPEGDRSGHDSPPLPHTPPMGISAVRPGVIDIYSGDKIDERIFVASGFAEVNEQGCTVLSGEAYPLDDLDKADVDERRSDAVDQLANADNDEERATAEAEIALCDAMLTALE